MEYLDNSYNHPLNDLKCEKYSLGHAQKWMIIEICAFFVNIMVLSMNIFLSILPFESIKKTLFKRRTKRSTKIINIIKERKLQLDFDNYKIIDEKQNIRIIKKKAKEIKTLMHEKEVQETGLKRVNTKSADIMENVDHNHLDVEGECPSLREMDKASDILKDLWITHYDLTSKI